MLDHGRENSRGCVAEVQAASIFSELFLPRMEAWKTSVVAAGVAAGFTLWQVRMREWSDRHTLATALQHYVVCPAFAMPLVGLRWTCRDVKMLFVLHSEVLLTPLKYAGILRIRRLLADAADGRTVQSRLAQELLRRHQFTEYGRLEGLQGVDCWDSFRQQHPVTGFSHYEPYLARIQEGEANILAAGRPLLLAMTSATCIAFLAASCCAMFATPQIQNLGL